jgi:hypothetical protein
VAHVEEGVVDLLGHVGHTLGRVSAHRTGVGMVVREVVFSRGTRCALTFSHTGDNVGCVENAGDGPEVAGLELAWHHHARLSIPVVHIDHIKGKVFWMFGIS